jgi:DNA adenine methylase
MIPYEENFYSQADADELFEFIKGQPFVRPDNKRNKTSRLRRLSFPGYSPPLPGMKHQAGYDVAGSMDQAPELYKRLADAITAYQLSQGLANPCTCLSTIGYLPDDHMNFHQHREDKKREDQTVYVISLGAVHPVAIRPLGCEDKSQWEIIYPKHGSLYVLPSSYNLTHEHAVLEGNDYSYGGLRIGINCKHIPAGLSPHEMLKACSRPAGAPQDKKPKPGAWVHPTLGLKVWCCREGYESPSDAVLVDRTTQFGNHHRWNLKDASERGGWETEARDKARTVEFRPLLESLRGKDLLCWCKPSEPFCHARIWLELANGTTTNAAVATPEPEPPEPKPPKRTRARPTSSPKIPTFGYPGSKARLAKRIAGMLPIGKRLVEPFAGRGNVYFYVAAHGLYLSYWLNDIQTAPFLFTMRIGHILGVPKPGKESLYKYRAASRDKTKSPLARSHSLLLEPYLCWNGGVYGQSGGTRRGTQDGYSKKIALASEILRGTDTKITRLDYRDVLTQCGEGDVVYLDPPYLNANVKAYTDKTLDHREMVEILKNAKFRWVLSEYGQPLYIKAFGEPALRIPVKRGTGKPGGGSKGQKEAVECLWTNFALTQRGIFSGLGPHLEEGMAEMSIGAGESDGGCKNELVFSET